MTLNRPSPRLSILRAQLAAEAEAIGQQRNEMAFWARFPITCKAPAPDAATLPLPPSYWDDLEHWLKTLAPAKPAAPQPAASQPASAWRSGQTIPKSERVGLWHVRIGDKGGSVAKGADEFYFDFSQYRPAALGVKHGDPYDESKYATADLAARLASTSSADGAALIGVKLTHSVCIKTHGVWKAGEVTSWRVTTPGAPEYWRASDADGWILHDPTRGDSSPVPLGVIAEAKWRKGLVASAESVGTWGPFPNKQCEIIAWRPIADGSK